MVEMDIFYMAIYPEKEGVFFNTSWMAKQPNILADLMPENGRFAKVVKVFDMRNRISAPVGYCTQKMICFFGDASAIGK
jgi:cytidine deaminase